LTPSPRVNTLGMPSTDLMHKARRLTIMERMTGGNGFSALKKEVRTYSDGTTRGERKRAARERANAAVSEDRAPQFMHSTARRKLHEQQLQAAA